MSQGSSPVKRKNEGKWIIDLTPRKGEKTREYPDPPGYSANRQQLKEAAGAAREGPDQQLINKRSWDIALGPIKGLPMNVFIMYMAGNTISIFPIMMVGMMFFRPIQAMMGIKNTIKMLEKAENWQLLTFVFALGNLLAIGLAVYKCHGMGLLPTHESDWLAFKSPLERREFVSGGISL